LEFVPSLVKSAFAHHLAAFYVRHAKLLFVYTS